MESHILTGRHEPFAQMLQNDLENLLASEELKEVTRGLLTVDPKKRMTLIKAKELLSVVVPYEDPTERMKDFAQMKGLQVQS